MGSIRWLFLVLVLAKAASYWMGSAIQRPDDPLSTIVLYRGKDIQAFPVLKNLSEFGVGEPSLYEGHNAGILSERPLPWFLHAMLFRLFGPAGFIVADLLLTPVWYFLFSRFLMLCGTPGLLARSAAAIIACATIDDFGNHSAGQTLPIHFWGLRIPRPFISELFLLVGLNSAMVVVHELASRRKPAAWSWVAIGAGLALLIQADIYTAMGPALVGGVALGWRWVSSPRIALQSLVRGPALAAAAGAVFLIPVFIQSLWIAPDVPVRLGLFPMSRARPPLITDGVWLGALLVLGLMSFVLSRFQRPAATQIDRKGMSRVVLLLLCGGALLAMPLVTILSGTGLQLYHFRESYVRFLAITALVIGLHMLGTAWDSACAHVDETAGARAARLVRQWGPAVLAVLVVGIGAWFSLRWSTAAPRREHHMRAEFQEWASVRRYRAGFVELVQELSRDEYDERLVLGTFDTQVWSWWITFRGGYSYLPDACFSNVSDAQIESRIAELAKIAGVGRTEFITLLRRPYVTIFWLGCAKYQASSAFTFSSIDDYDASERSGILATPSYRNFAVALPRTEQARLAQVYDTVDTSRLNRLDLLVLTKDPSMLGIVPTLEEFEPAFENHAFRVWTRRKGR